MTKGACVRYRNGWLIFGLLLLLISCGEIASTDLMTRVDKWNKRADVYRFSSLDSTFLYAKKAYVSASGYRKGKAEAANILGFCAFMHMEYVTAESYYLEAMSATSNELEQLMANIGLMKLCQVTANNRRFYDYKYSAERQIQRITEDRSVFFDAHSKYRVQRALNDFLLTCATYHQYLQQQEERRAYLLRISPRRDFLLDAPGFLHYQWVKSAGDSFDLLYSIWRESVRKGAHYWAGRALLQLTDLLCETHAARRLSREQEDRIRQDLILKDNGLSLMGLMVNEAELELKKYTAGFPLPTVFRHRASALNASERYGAAIHELTRALNFFNVHHKRAYPQGDTLQVLRAEMPMDSVYTELKWISSRRVMTFPACLANVREELSVAFAGLDMKPESDYNRNVYLDILDYTRQDRKLERRYAVLQQEARDLNVLLWGIVIGIVTFCVLLWWLNLRWKKRNELHMHQLELTLTLCQQLFSAIPLSVASLEDILKKVLAASQDTLFALFGDCALVLEHMEEESLHRWRFPDKKKLGVFCSPKIELLLSQNENSSGNFCLYTNRALSLEQLTLLRVIAPYLAWIVENGRSFIALGDEQLRIEKERYIHDLHIKLGREENVNKQACLTLLTGMQPFIDRLLHECKRLNDGKLVKTAEYKGHFVYLKELTERIIEYNKILAWWIKMKQGKVGLHIEPFALEDIFEMARKGHRSFEMKEISFEVKETKAVVKADKTLTLFMVNTLLENARKYTLKGGKVLLESVEMDEYVEISVHDTGIGLSEEDKALIIDVKVYDSTQIGIKENRKLLMDLKGSGFGLMNCRGIIERYQKTNDLFRVCCFGVESALGEGSRFYFRLPKGVKRLLLCCACLFFFAACDVTTVRNDLFSTEGDRGMNAVDLELIQTDSLLIKASEYADSAFYSNLKGDYRNTLLMAEKAINYLNVHFEKHTTLKTSSDLLMSLYSSEAEMVWYNMNFPTDFHTVLDVRNESAIAALALHNWKVYQVNNKGYTDLYKLLSKDNSLEQYCVEMQHTMGNKRVALVLFVSFFIVLVFCYLVIYFRKRIVAKMNLEQVLNINKQAFASSMMHVDPLFLMQIPERLMVSIYREVNELFSIDRLGLALALETESPLRYIGHGYELNEQEKEGLNLCFKQERLILVEEEHLFFAPLLVRYADKQHCVGAMVFRKTMGKHEGDEVLMQLIAHFIAVVLDNAVLKKQAKYEDIELAEDERRRAQWEEGLIHIQNRLLDNSLSTVKHETVYYPHRILQMVNQLEGLNMESKEFKLLTSDLVELTSYYKGVYSLLNQRAVRQLSPILFRRSKISVESILNEAEMQVKRLSKRKKIDVLLITSGLEVDFWGDKTEMEYMMKLLALISVKKEDFISGGRLSFTVELVGKWVKFNWINTGMKCAKENLDLLFSPTLHEKEAQDGDEWTGEAYLVMKQIIRDHDAYAGLRGCRIYAEEYKDKGSMICFTLPLVQKTKE